MSNKPKAVVFDLDGTLADITHRLYWIKHCKPKRWDKFQQGVMDDVPKWEIIKLFWAIQSDVDATIIASGRNEEVREETELWLKEHHLHPDKLMMRGLKDYRKDYIIKNEMRIEIEKEYDILFVVDDRDQVVSMWREHGLTCLQVADGDF